MRTKGVLVWVIVCLWLLGTIGGIGYTLWCHAWVIAAGVAANAVLAFFKVKDLYNEAMK